MAIAFRGISSASTRTAADPIAAPALPTGTVSGDMVLLILLSRPSSTTVATQPAGWHNIANNEITGGAGAEGLDSGTVRVKVWARQYDGVWTMPSIDMSAVPNSLVAHAISYSKAAGETWTVIAAAGADTTGSATSIVTTASSTIPSFAAGDWVGVVVGVNGDIGTPTVPTTISATGVTFGTATSRINIASATGNGCRMLVADRPYTSGTATAGLVSSTTYASGGASTAGAAVFYQLRVSTPVTTTNTFEGGTNGTTITAGNSGGASGTAFGWVQNNAGTTATYVNTNVARGTLSGRLTTGASAVTYLEISSGQLAHNSFGQMYGRVRMRLTALPGTATFKFFTYSDSSGNWQGVFGINNTGKLTIMNSAGTVTNTSTNSITLNQWFDVGFAILAFSATAGQLEAKLYLTADSDTPTETLTSTATLNTLGNGGAGYGQLGVPQAAASIDMWLDDIQFYRLAYPTSLGPLNSSGATVTGAASLDSTTTLGAVGITTATGAVLTAGSTTLSATAKVDTAGGTILAVASMLAATGKAITSGTVTASATSALVAVGSTSVVGTVAMSSVSTLVVAGTTAPFGASLRAGVSTLTVVGTTAPSGSAIMSATSTLTVVGTRTTQGAVLTAGSTTLAVTGSVRTTGAVVLTAQSSITAQGDAALGATLNAASSMSVIPSVTVRAGAALSSAGGILSVGFATVPGSVQLTGNSALTTTAKVAVAGAVTMTASSVLTTSANTSTTPPSAVLNAASTLVVVGSVTRIGAALAASAGAFTVAATVTTQGASVLTGQSNMVSVGGRQILGAAVFTGTSTFAVAASTAVGGTVILTGTTTVVTAGQVVRTGSVTLTGVGTVAVAGKTTAIAAVVLSGQTTIATVAFNTTRGSVVLTGITTVTTSGGAFQLVIGGSIMSASSLLVVSGGTNPPWTWPFIEGGTASTGFDGNTERISGRYEIASSNISGMEAA